MIIWNCNNILTFSSDDLFAQFSWTQYTQTHTEEEIEIDVRCLEPTNTNDTTMFERHCDTCCRSFVTCGKHNTLLWSVLPSQEQTASKHNPEKSTMIKCMGQTGFHRENKTLQTGTFYSGKEIAYGRR